MKYKKGQKVRIVSDFDNYQHCVGKIGIIQESVDDDNVDPYHPVDVIFNFKIPEDNNTSDDHHTRYFYLCEIEPLTKEETVKTLLQKLKI